MQVMAEAQGWVMMHLEEDSSEKVKRGVCAGGAVRGVGWMLSSARGVWGWQWQLVLPKPQPGMSGGTRRAL